MLNPKTSIIIRTFNEERHLENLLRAIQEQSFTDYEIVLVDSGSTDRTLEIAGRYPVRIVEIESRDFTFGYSLNVGCREARGEYLVFVSAHVKPMHKEWLGNLIAAFKNPDIAMAYGRQTGTPESKFSEQMDFERFFKPTAENSEVPIGYANNANSAVRKTLWDDWPFDEYLFGLEDIDWARAMTAKGYMVHYEPEAPVYHIHEESWPQVFNRYRREAIAAARIGVEHPPQARTEARWFFANLLRDSVRSFPNWRPARLGEIARFRYFQWKGTRQGWFFDKDIDLDRQKYELFYPSGNDAVVVSGPGRAALAQIPLPDIKPGDVLIQVHYVGVCGTDIEVYDGTLGYYRDGVASYPIVPGHEFSGRIIKIGAHANVRERFAVGDAVVGECILSRDPAHRQEVGVINCNGAYSSYIVIPGEFVHKIPEDIDMKSAVLAEPLAVALRAIRRAEYRFAPGASIAVLGAGPLGNLCAQALTQKGYHVAVFDADKHRAGALSGIAQQTHTAIENLVAFDAIIEATGSRSVLEQALRESRADSTLVLLGLPYGPISYNFEGVVEQEKAVIGSVGADSRAFADALEMLPVLNTDPLINTTLPLAEFKNAWNLQRSAVVPKIILQP